MNVFKKAALGSLGLSVLFINAIPVYGVSNTDSLTIYNSLEHGVDSVEKTADIITDSIDSLTIENTVTNVSYPSDMGYTSVYTYSEPYIENQNVSTTMTVNEFMALYGGQGVISSVDASVEQAAYEQALANYNVALAEYEAANQMIETTKEIEVEIIEEVTDEEGNVTQVTRTELQTVTEMVPAGDTVSAQANLDAASAALNDAKMALDSAKSSTATVDTVVIHPETTEDEKVQSIVDSDSNENEQAQINENVVVKEDKTYAGSGTCGDNLTWTLDDNGTLTISGTGDMTNYSDYSSAPWRGVKSVVLPEGITSIGNRAFSSCQIRNIDIPSGVKYIGDYAFAYNYQITGIYIPSGVEYIGEYAFNNCENLSDVIIPDSVTYIGYKAFYETPFIENYTDDFVVLGNGVLYAYNGNEPEIIIPNNVIHIGGAFNRKLGISADSNVGITSITIPDGVKSVGPFYSIGRLTSISIPDSVSGIGSFQICNSLISFTIPSGVTTLKRNLFTSCTALKNIFIPATVTEIEEGFYYVSELNGGRLSDIYFEGSEEEWNQVIGHEFVPSSVKQDYYGDLPEINVKIHFGIPSGKLTDNIIWTMDRNGLLTLSGTGGCDITNVPWDIGRVKKVSIGQGITGIGRNAFKGCCNLESVSIPETVTFIGNGAFSNCSNLKSIIIPSSVTEIGDNTFAGCKQLRSVRIPDSVKAIGNGTFRECESLKSIVIPSNINSIGNGAFFSCKSLSSLVIPSSVTSIGEGAFSNCEHLKNITLPESISKIERGTFSGCSLLSDITIPVSVQTIADSAFESCSSLKSITIPKDAVSIDSNAFLNCTNLTDVTIPNSVTNIGDRAFYRCYELSDVYYQGKEEDWNNKDLYFFGDGITIHFVGIPLPFTDVPEDAWYYSTARECYETGLINGTSETTFSPMQTMTRAMVVTILWRMDGQPKTAFNNKFKDVSSSQWYATSISWAEKAGVVHGYGDGTFKPDAAVTREQVAVMLANYAQYKKVYQPGTKKLNTYPDGSQVSTWAQAGMKWALTNGIVSGDGAGYLRPKKSATRAEGAAMLLRMKNWI